MALTINSMELYREPESVFDLVVDNQDKFNTLINDTTIQYKRVAIIGDGYNNINQDTNISTAPTAFGTYNLGSNNITMSNNYATGAYNRFREIIGFGNPVIWCSQKYVASSNFSSSSPAFVGYPNMPGPSKISGITLLAYLQYNTSDYYHRIGFYGISKIEDCYFITNSSKNLPSTSSGTTSRWRGGFYNCSHLRSCSTHYNNSTYTLVLSDLFDYSGYMNSIE